MGIIKLDAHSWFVDLEADVLGTGGTATVYAGYAVTDDEIDDHQPVAIKLMNIGAAGDRELLLNDVLRANHFDNVIRILDTGELDGRIAIVMPRADQNLTTYLADHSPDAAEATAIVTDVATALASITGSVVHRDIKPDNILFLDGRWQVGDFGIARIADATTSSHTRRAARTPEYAAPEQYEEERATSAADVYSLGAVAFELFEGHRPFPGPSDDDYRDQHRCQQAPIATHAPTHIQRLIRLCLIKNPSERPTAARILERLQNPPSSPPSAARTLLAAADAGVIQRAADRDAALAKHDAHQRELNGMQAGGREIHATFIAELIASITSEATTADHTDMLTGDRLVLGNGTLSIDAPEDCDMDLEHFRVIVAASMSVQQQNTNGSLRILSCSLWYCDAFTPGEFAWYELGFASAEPGHQPPVEHPYALHPRSVTSYFDHRSASQHQINGPMFPVDPLDPDEFIDRWATRLALASSGDLPPVHAIPEAPDDRRWMNR